MQKWAWFAKAPFSAPPPHLYSWVTGHSNNRVILGPAWITIKVLGKVCAECRWGYTLVTLYLTKLYVGCSSCSVHLAERRPLGQWQWGLRDHWMASSGHTHYSWPRLLVWTQIRAWIDQLNCYLVNCCLVTCQYLSSRVHELLLSSFLWLFVWSCCHVIVCLLCMWRVGGAILGGAIWGWVLLSKLPWLCWAYVFMDTSYNLRYFSYS